MLETIKRLGAYGVLVTLFGLGVTVASVFWASTVASLNAENKAIQQRLTDKSEELARVKSEYALNLGGREVSQNNPGKALSLDTTSAEDSIDTSVAHADPGTQLPPTRWSEERTINREASYSFHGGEVTISVAAIDFGGSPLRNRVIASILTREGDTGKVEGKDVGYVVQVGSRKKYRVLVTKADTFNATFRVEEL